MRFRNSAEMWDPVVEAPGLLMIRFFLIQHLQISEGLQTKKWEDG